MAKMENTTCIESFEAFANVTRCRRHIKGQKAGQTGCKRTLLYTNSSNIRFYRKVRRNITSG